MCRAVQIRADGFLAVDPLSNQMENIRQPSQSEREKSEMRHIGTQAQHTILNPFCLSRQSVFII
jgi:hypothetical protein